MNYLPLHPEFKKRKAHFIPFGNWEVPAYFTSIIDEHETVRQRSGLFDISHMGFLRVEGEDAHVFMQHLVTNDINLLRKGGAFYTPLCNEVGGIVDDIFVYKVTNELFFLVVNAANCEKDFMWLKSHINQNSVTVENLSPEKAIFALQGPASPTILKKAWNIDLERMPFHSFMIATIDNTEVVISTTGYTGEMGCEIIFNREKALSFFTKLFEIGEPLGLKLIGFGARDTLRLEACCLLYGQDIDEMTTPWEAGLGWTVKLEGEYFMGKQCLMEQKAQGVARKLISFEMCDKAIPRTGYEILRGDEQIGKVTSGSFGPTVGKNIGLGYVETPFANKGEDILIAIRNKHHPARIVARPFYKR